MKRWTIALGMFGVTLVLPAGSRASTTAVMTVYGCETCGSGNGGGNLALDGNVQQGSPQPTFVIGTPGSLGEAALWYVTKFKLSTILPNGITAADIVSATVDVPDQGRIRNNSPTPDTFDLVLQHFATDDNTSVVGHDGDTTIAPSDAQWLAIPKGSATTCHCGTGTTTCTPCFVTIDVTSAVQADVSNSHQLASFRLGHDPAEAPLGTSSQYTICDSSGVGSSFCPPSTSTTPNMMRLTVTYNPPVLTCGNGLDCSLPQCQCDAGCHAPGACDFATCGKAFCSDPACGSLEPCVEAQCSDYVDNDSNGLTDCQDPHCTGGPSCPTEVFCDDGIDNDGDGLVDAADPDCANLVTVTVANAGNLNLDANVQTQTEASPNLTFILATPGGYQGVPLWFVSKFKLPADVTSADILSAQVEVPDQNTVRSGNPGAYDFVLQHFATQDNTKVVLSDREVYSGGTNPALFDFKTVIPKGGTGHSGNAAVVHRNVTAAVKADLDAGRPLSSFRLGANPAELASEASIDAYQFGSADCAALNGGAGSPGFCPPDGNPNVVKLIIALNRPLPKCGTPFADTDGDGDVDMDDFALYQTCFTGPGANATLSFACNCLDRNHDHSIDHTDFAAWQFCATGPNVAADPTCGN